MKCTLEAVAYVMRWHHDDVPGEQQTTFFASATVTVNDEKLACLRGLTMDHFTEAARDAMYETLAGIGVKRILYTRRNNGRRRVINRRISP